MDPIDTASAISGSAWVLSILAQSAVDGNVCGHAGPFRAPRCIDRSTIRILFPNLDNPSGTAFNTSNGPQEMCHASSLPASLHQRYRTGLPLPHRSERRACAKGARTGSGDRTHAAPDDGPARRFSRNCRCRGYRPALCGGFDHRRGGTTAARRSTNEHFIPLKVANFGIGGDTTQGVLWRMRNGELEGFEARLIVHMLGTNNINPQFQRGHCGRESRDRRRVPSPPAADQGSDPGCLPRGEEPGNPYRASIAEINNGLAGLADDRRVFYLDIGDAFSPPTAR